MCHIEKKVPDEWQAQQVIPAILRASNSKHNAKKNTTRIRGKFHQSITAIFTEEKKRGNLPNLHMLQSACFRTKIETGVDSKDDSGSQCQYREQKKRSKRENDAGYRTL